MGIEEYNLAKDQLQNKINDIDKKLTIHSRGKIEGYTISKVNVMKDAKALKVELLNAWNNYKIELQLLVV